MSAWASFLIVFAASIIGSCVVVGFYSLGMRLLSAVGHAPYVEPAEFTDAITVITPEQASRAQRKIEKARKKSPLSPGQKRLVLTSAYGCFTLCGLAVLYGIYLILPYFNS